MRLGGLQKTSLIDYPQKVCAIVFTAGCNFRCPYCHNPELVDETVDELSEADFFTFLDRRATLLDAVTVSGGEPTIHPDLISFITRIKKYGLLVKLDSNGSNTTMLAELIKLKLVDYIAMDIKAPLEKYEQTVARPVDTNNLKHSIDLLRSNQVDYEFRTTVVKSLLSIEDFYSIGELISGAKRYYLQPFIPTKLLNPAFQKKACYSLPELERIQHLMSRYVSTCLIRQ